MSEIKIEEIKRRSVSGVLALTSRTAFLQIISFTGIFLLTIFLSPEVFGIFFVVSAIIAFLNYFSDIGLAAALIQKKEEITQADLKTTFTIQQVIVITVMVLALFFSQKIALFYNLSREGLWLFRALTIAFFLSSLKTIPSIILERKLMFNRLVIPQIVEVLFFYILAVYLAWQGWGVASFTYAVLARGLAGLVVIYTLQPWMPSLALNRKSAKKLLSFGIPFQFNSFLALIKDTLFTLYLGKTLPFSQVGYIGWAKKWAEAPLRLIMDSIVKVTFPTYSRLQSYPEKLSHAINKSFFFLALFIFPMSISLAFLIKPLVFLIPKYLKWEPALLSFYLFIVASALASISTPLTNALNAIGRIKVTLKLMIMWTSLTWLLAPLFIFLIGFNGFALVSLLIGLTIWIVILISRQYLEFRVLDNITPALISSLVMAFYMLVAEGFFTRSILGLSFYSLCAGVVYVASLLLFFRKKTVEEFKSVYSLIRSEN